nr:MAG TPA: hypothetical protein [Caudoviricetes sp.]
MSRFIKMNNLRVFEMKSDPNSSHLAIDYYR